MKGIQVSTVFTIESKAGSEPEIYLLGEIAEIQRSLH